MKNQVRHIYTIVVVFAVFAAALCYLSQLKASNRAERPKPMQVSFSGEYSSDGIHWQAFSEASDPVFSGSTVLLRGSFSQEIPAGKHLCYYQDHIGVAISIDGKLLGMDTVSQMNDLHIPRMDNACCSRWGSIRSPGILPSEAVEIRLTNPHAFSGTGFRSFLFTLCVNDGGSEFLKEALSPYGKILRGIAMVMAVVSFMLFGAAIVAFAQRIPVVNQLLLRSVLVFFVGGLFYFDTLDVAFQHPALLASSYGWQLCLVVYGWCLTSCLLEPLSGAAKRIGCIALLIEVLLGCGMFLCSLHPSVALYDTLPFCVLALFAGLSVVTVLLVIRYIRSDRKEWLYPMSAMLSFLALILDLFGICGSIISHFSCTKAAFVILLAVHLVFACNWIVRSFRAASHVKTLEKELEESRIAVMLSQIRPHFLFNSLGAIQELCHSEPAVAEAAIEKFALYLRGNMSILTAEKLIPFEEEMKHVQSYLELEKLRFGDQLEIFMDLEAVSFHLPVLTVQPLVENAIRHGVRKRENGGWVRLSTREFPDRWEIWVEDNGPGFHTPLSDPTSEHIGLQNVRFRLENTCCGQLALNSVPGEGTCVSVIIPKENPSC